MGCWLLIYLRTYNASGFRQAAGRRSQAVTMRRECELTAVGR